MRGVASTVAAFFQKVDYPHGLNGCWFWTGALDSDGYAVFGEGSSTRGAQRVAYEWFVGLIPEGLHADHLCRNIRCVNPAHLECVTTQENTARRFAKLCNRGHAIVGANAYLHLDGRSGRSYSECLICRRRDASESGRQRKERKEQVGSR